MRAWPLLLVAALSIACSARPATSDDGGETTDMGSQGSSSSSSGAETTSSEGGSETETETGESDDQGFVMDADMGVYDPCSVYDQDCPEGAKCVPSISPNHSPSRCVPVLGDHAVGEACTFDGHETGTDDCDVDSHCWPGDWDGPEPLMGTCAPFCQGSEAQPSCPGQGESCIGYVCHVLGQIGIPVCMLTCDVFAQDCGEGMACYFSYFNYSYGCSVVAGDAALGEVCETYDQCAAGYQCIGSENLPSCGGDSCCTTYCELGDDASCDAALPGTVCSDALANPMADGCPAYGLCALPQP